VLGGETASGCVEPRVSRFATLLETASGCVEPRFSRFATLLETRIVKREIFAKVLYIFHSLHYAAINHIHKEVHVIKLQTVHTPCGPDSVVGIATAYGLDGPGIESRWGARFSAPVQAGSEAHPASCTMGTRSSPGVKCGRGLTLTPQPLLVSRSKIE
jgi:hypothetical protein